MNRQLPLIAILADRYFQYQAELVENIATDLQAVGYGTLCVTARELAGTQSTDPAHAVSNSVYSEINGMPIQGIISLSGTIGHGIDAENVCQFLKSFNVPTVSLGMNLPDIVSVYFQEDSGMQALMDHLLENDALKSFAFIRGHHNDPYSGAREEIFRNSLLAKGLHERHLVYLEGNYDPYTTYQAVTELLREQQMVDCIVAANDVMAASAARAAKAYGLSIPENIAICGFDDSSDATRHSPALTTVRQSVSKISQTSVTLLLQQLAKQSNGATGGNEGLAKSKLRKINSVAINSELISRRSTSSAEIELELSGSLDESKLNNMLHNAMNGLETPDYVSLKDISEALWKTISSGSNDIVALSQQLNDAAIFQNSHWFLNMSDHVQLIGERLLDRGHAKEPIALLNSATSKVKERIWSFEMDKRFEASRLENVRFNMQLSMSSCTTIDEIKVAMNDWLIHLKPQRCFLVCYDNVASVPDKTAHLVHLFKHGQSIEASPDSFNSIAVLPEQLAFELAEGLLVLSPVYAENLLFGYLLIDPRGMNLLYIDAAAQCIGNAMRTQHHIKTLEARKDNLQSVNAELEHLANYDALTGLANRLQFQQHLQERTVGNASADNEFALLFIDLDGFKLINDTLGHSVGDQLLNQVAQRLLKSVSLDENAKSFISRLGGDEFTVILEHCGGIDAIRATTEALLQVISSPYFIDENEVSISASIGCALYPEDAVDADTLVKHADIAMYRAKNNGKNAIAFFDNHMVSSDAQEYQLAKELRYALENDELCMFYQPRIDLNTGQMCSVEALMRWFKTSGDGTEVRAYPDVFIALAEKIGLISKLDTYALHYCCKQAAQWAQNGTPLQVSVNVSVTQLQQDDFVATIVDAITQYQLDPRLIELEITESAAMTDVESNIRKLSELKKIGIQVSIDDFGTGYSSLSYLKKLPVSRLKIDRSFIQDIIHVDGSEQVDAAIVRSIVALGKIMQLGLVAEGIETQAQHEFICSLDCDQAQGYLYEKPVSAKSITALLSDECDHQTINAINYGSVGDDKAA